MFPIHNVSLGAATSSFYRCSVCASCQTATPFEAEAVEEFYRTSYFHRADWEVAKARILAGDYLRKVRGHLPRLRATAKVLEIGAGYGFFAHAIHHRLGVQVDVVEPSVDCRSYISTEFPDTLRVFESMESLPADATYDVVFCFHVLEHLQRAQPFFEKVLRRLNVGGHALFLTPNGASRAFLEAGQYWGWACANQHYQFLSDRIPRNFFTALGFTVVTQRDVDPATIHYPSRWLSSIHRSSDSANRRSYWRRLCWAIPRRLLAPNRSRFGLLSLEKGWRTILRFRPRDELFLVLKRESNA